jgi:uncharacterized membrane protein
MLMLTLSWAAGCRHQAAPQAQDRESNQVVLPAVTATSIPLEPPVETLRVQNSGFPCAIDDLLAAKCRRCHTVPARHNAPFPLLTWDDAHGMIGDRQRYVVMASVTKSGYMPYNVPANPPVELLTDEEKKTIADWAEAGAPKAACPPVASGSAKRNAPKTRGDAVATPQARRPL